MDYANGKYSAGVVAFVFVTVRNLDIRRENIGYATTSAPMKGSAIYQARKVSNLTELPINRKIENSLLHGVLVCEVIQPSFILNYSLSLIPSRFDVSRK